VALERYFQELQSFLWKLLNSMWELWIWKVTRFITWQNKKYSRFFFENLEIFCHFDATPTINHKVYYKEENVHYSHVWDVLCLVNWKLTLQLVCAQFAWTIFFVGLCILISPWPFCLWVCLSATLELSPPFSPLGTKERISNFYFITKLTINMNFNPILFDKSKNVS